MSKCEDIQLIKSEEPKNSGKMIYFLTVFTGKVRNAGTDANVFVEIIGNNGKTSPIKLENDKKKNKFETGQLDHFVVSSTVFINIQSN